jgi:hypothetical protein
MAPGVCARCPDRLRIRPTEATLRRLILSVVFFVLVASCPSLLAEEISLKDGTKIVGHMIALSPDKIEVETSYGKIQLKRTDILSINFPENGTASASANGANSQAQKTDAPSVDEVLNGLQYVNRTGKFTLTLPPDWMISTDIHRAPDTLTALSSRDKMRYLLVVQEQYPGSLESYKEVALLNARRTLSNFEELSQSQATIDGKSALFVFYRGNLQKSSNLPVEFVSAIIASGNTYTRLTAWCVEPLFHDMQPAFEKLLNSYHATAGQTTATASKP